MEYLAKVKLANVGASGKPTKQFRVGARLDWSIFRAILNGVEYKLAGARPSWTIRRRKNFLLADDSSDVVSATPK